MPVKPTISKDDFPKILANYNLGEYERFRRFAHGAGQTTTLLITTKGRFVLRYYENRPERYVLFEVDLLHHLKSKGFPVPVIMQDSSGRFSEMYKGKPYMIIEHIDGRHTRNPNYFSNAKQIPEVAQVVAKLHNLTRDYTSAYLKDRNDADISKKCKPKSEPKDRDELNAEYCLRMYKQRSYRTDIVEEWLKNELKKLEFPSSLPKGICHADLNYSNFLFKERKIVALLDFDMSFRTYCIYDIANLIYWWAWAPEKELKEKEARRIAEEYSRWRPLGTAEKEHIYDALKLVILLGMSWSKEDDFKKGRKNIEFLDSVGREGFYGRLFKEEFILGEA